MVICCSIHVNPIKNARQRLNYVLEILYHAFSSRVPILSIPGNLQSKLFDTPKAGFTFAVVNLNQLACS